MNFKPASQRVKFLCQIILILAGLASVRAGEPGVWHPMKAPLMTRWAAEVSPTNVWPEYPRPQLVRLDWMNLNGLWDYAITPDSTNRLPPFAGKILIPFPVESALSGVMTNFNEHSKLWYHRSFSVPESWRGQRARLHFGAVDWHCQAWVNGRGIGQHQGGYDAFTFDITDALRWQGAEVISVCVTDPTEGGQPRGKQSRKPEGIFYTSSSGIWQTVWLEPVSEVCIDRLKTVPDVDAKSLRLRVAVNSFSENLQVEAMASFAGKEITLVTGLANAELVLSLPNPHLWSPDDPFLYDLKVTLQDGDKLLDSVSSYFGLRKIALRKDDQGFTQIALNNQFIFQVGTLDQGFWPDGIYTAPTDEALRSDIEFLKKAGFNLTRKHVKVEPDRWYYWCDKLGLLVWQDMPSGNKYIGPKAPDITRTPESAKEYEQELTALVRGRGNHPCIVMWVPYNEGWGQWDTARVVAMIQKLDPNRLVDNTSGWSDRGGGDVNDLHKYPGPGSPEPEANRAVVLGEFGGLGLPMRGHTWQSEKNWGYRSFTDAESLTAAYVDLAAKLFPLLDEKGLSAADER